MFAVTQHTKEQKELNTRERKGQDATKITYAFEDSCIQFSLVRDADSDDNTDVDGEKNSQPKHHRGVHRGDR